MIAIEHTYLADTEELLRVSKPADYDSVSPLIRNYATMMGGESLKEFTAQGDTQLMTDPSILERLSIEVVNSYVRDYSKDQVVLKSWVMENTGFSEALLKAGDTDNAVLDKVSEVIRSNGFVEGMRVLTMALPKLTGRRIDLSTQTELTDAVEDLVLDMSLAECLFGPEGEISFANARAVLIEKSNIIAEVRDTALTDMEKSFEDVAKRIEKYPTQDMFTDGYINSIVLHNATVLLSSLVNPLSSISSMGCVRFNIIPVHVEIKVEQKVYDLGTVMKMSLDNVASHVPTIEISVVPDEALGGSDKLPDITFMKEEATPEVIIRDVTTAKRISDMHGILREMFTEHVTNAGSDKFKNAVMLGLITHLSGCLVSMLGAIGKMNDISMSIDDHHRQLTELNTKMNALFVDAVR